MRDLEGCEENPLSTFAVEGKSRTGVSSAQTLSSSPPREREREITHPLVHLCQERLEDFPLQPVLGPLGGDLVDQLVQARVRVGFVLFKLAREVQFPVDGFDARFGFGRLDAVVLLRGGQGRKRVSDGWMYENRSAGTLTSRTLRCCSEAFANALLINQLHLLSKMSVPILPICSGVP
jgi:hypothetical protein